MKLVILDRDGTINKDSDQYIKSPSEWKPIPGSLEAIARLTQGGWRDGRHQNASTMAVTTVRATSSAIRSTTCRTDTR